MHVFVAGGTGVIGRRVVPMLVAAGHDVTAAARADDDARWLRSAGARAVAVDALDHDLLVRVVETARPDAIVHQLTALSGGSTKANAELRVHGTRNLVDAALVAGTRRIVAQSIAWAYGPGDRPAVEAEPLDVDVPEPRAVTVAGVVSLETTVAELPEPVVLRYGTLYGPGTWYHRIGRTAEQARSGELAADDAVNSFLHVDDAAAACAAALRWEPCTANVCDDEPAAAAEWVPEFARGVGAPVPAAQRGRPSWARGADNHFARHTLGLDLRYPTWRTGFRTEL